MAEFRRDIGEVLFRCFFCLIFLGLGAEHLFSDQLVQLLMPQWLPYKRLFSLLCGLWLLGWGSQVLVGWKLRRAAIGLAAFLLVVTVVVHLPGVYFEPDGVSEDCMWMWTILQRSNLVKNLCLLGVCIHLLDHEPRRFSLEAYWRRKTEKL